MSSKSHNSGCSIALTTDIIGDRWSLLVLRDMMFHGKKRYCEFLDSNEKIATNILSNRLAELAERGIIAKSRDPDNYRSNLFHLTQRGVGLAPVLFAMATWGAPQLAQTPAQIALLDRINNAPEKLLAEIRARSV